MAQVLKCRELHATHDRDAGEVKRIGAASVDGNAAAGDTTVACLLGDPGNLRAPAAAGTREVVHGTPQDILKLRLGLGDLATQASFIEIAEV